MIDSLHIDINIDRFINFHIYIYMEIHYRNWIT